MVTKMQQQQSKLGSMAPQKIGAGAKKIVGMFAKMKPMIDKKAGGMDDLKNFTKPEKSPKASDALKKVIKTTPGFRSKKVPTFNQVQKSIKKTMGYK